MHLYSGERKVASYTGIESSVLKCISGFVLVVCGPVDCYASHTGEILLHCGLSGSPSFEIRILPASHFGNLALFVYLFLY